MEAVHDMKSPVGHHQLKLRYSRNLHGIWVTDVLAPLVSDFDAFIDQGPRLQHLRTACLYVPSQAAQCHTERERERKFNLSIQPALAYEDVSMLESSAKLRMAAKQ